MKRLVIAGQIIVAAFILTKFLFLAEGVMYRYFLHTPDLYHPGQAIAQTPAREQAVSEKDPSGDGFKKERELLALLQKRQKELDLRESAVKADEQKLAAVKKEIMDKIETLKALDAQLSAKLEIEKTNDAKRLKDLAKVFEAIPPQKAAAMLEKLDIKTAAGITINMKRDRAGLIWGHLNPQKGVEITREITKSAKTQPE